MHDVRIDPRSTALLAAAKPMQLDPTMSSCAFAGKPSLPGRKILTALICCIGLYLTTLSNIASANTTTAELAAGNFATCVAQLKETAKGQGISTTTIDAVFGNVEQLPRVINADRKQPEFTTTFADYYNKRVTSYRIEQGRKLRDQHGGLLAKVGQASGIPAQYLLAFWGLETNFGQYFGKLYIPSALATLACDRRRAEFFSSQMQAVLKIVEDGDMQASQLVGSWAGAIGHMQFMPTTYIAHAQDGDGDKKADLRGSLADAMVSAGGYLRDIGWQPGFRWGREVLLPAGFDYSLTGRDKWQPLRNWSKLGITDVFNKPITAMDLSAALLVPSGHTGPAFLVYPNFEIIMKWNRSEFYALSVGRLADRIAGAGRLHQPIPDLKISTTDLVSIQSDLATLGYQPGKADGILGSGTRNAIQAFQKAQQLLQPNSNKHTIVADGFPNPQLKSLLAEAVATGAKSRSSDNKAP